MIIIIIIIRSAAKKKILKKTQSMQKTIVRHRNTIGVVFSEAWQVDYFFFLSRQVE